MSFLPVGNSNGSVASVKLGGSPANIVHGLVVVPEADGTSVKHQASSSHSVVVIGAENQNQNSESQPLLGPPNPKSHSLASQNGSHSESHQVLTT